MTNSILVFHDIQCIGIQRCCVQPFNTNTLYGIQYQYTVFNGAACNHSIPIRCMSSNTNTLYSMVLGAKCYLLPIV